MTAHPFYLAVFVAVAACSLATARALTQINVGEDQANQGMYNGGWNQGSGGDNGFFAWKMVSKADGEGSFAGHYLGRLGEKPELAPITKDRVFALFANGKSYEESVAFRGIAVPLEPGDNFSFEILHGPFQQKGDEDDPAPGEVGVTYRAGNADGSISDIDAGARLRFFAREGSPNYLITDSEQEFDTGIPITEEALALTLTLVDADTYDFEVINLRDKAVKILKGRKFGGQAGAPIQSLAFFNRNAEAHDFFLNNFQLSRNSP
ncbi:MAG: hypothetical protein FGM15_12320 [Chthoniobacterales bacterium]|nr:hypothetical protein [Chthoniobacterales bacterium]